MEPLLVNVSGDLKPILEKVCDLLAVYELVATVDSGSDLHALLGQNIEDSCNWVSSHRKYIHVHTSCYMMILLWNS